MLLAARYPKGPRGRGAVDPAHEKGADSASFRRVKEARYVIEYCPELIAQVIDGKVGLDEALKEAQRRRSVGMANEAGRAHQFPAGEMGLSRFGTRAGGLRKSHVPPAGPRRSRNWNQLPFRRASLALGQCVGARQ
jgi:hypothetical protein